MSDISEAQSREKDVSVGAMGGILEIEGKRYARPDALAEMLGVTTRTLLRWEDRRVGPARIKVGNLRLYDLSAIPEWLKQHEREGCRVGKARV